MNKPLPAEVGDELVFWVSAGGPNPLASKAGLTGSENGWKSVEVSRSARPVSLVSEGVGWIMGKSSEAHPFEVKLTCTRCDKTRVTP